MPVDFDALGASVMNAFAEPVPVRYLPVDHGPEIQLRGIFDRYQVDVMTQEGASMSIKSSKLSLRQAELPEGFYPLQGDRVFVQGLTFDITDVQPDSFGWIFLPLGYIG